jgi:hypothetical protein
MPERSLSGKDEQLLEHLDHVLVRVFVIIQKNNMEQMPVFVLLLIKDGRCTKGSNTRHLFAVALLLEHRRAK